MKTFMRAMGLARFAEATMGVGQLTVAEFAGEAMVTPGPCAFTSRRVAATEEAPPLSTTVAVTVKVASFEYLCVALLPDITVPSPKSMVEPVMEPSGSEDPEVLAVTVRSAVNDAFRTAGRSVAGLESHGRRHYVADAGLAHNFDKERSRRGQIELREIHGVLAGRHIAELSQILAVSGSEDRVV